MRPKFRAWTEEGKVMYYDVYPFKDDTLLLSYDEIAFDEVPASDFILMQSTELKDKNDNEIFEGDIVKYKSGCNTYTEEVAYDKNFAGFGVRDANADIIFTFWELAEDIDLISLEVVGNIYENPELLEEE
ncbi:YopX family protein [Streptococcus alactolyticus]|uniref:YopX family protein n=1 Tax=Streptococcus alactolyticus TaxID=29389 RepID=UPI003752888B